MQKLKTVLYFLVIFVYIYAFCVLLISKATPKSEMTEADDDEEPGDDFDEIPLSDAPIPSLSHLASQPPPAPPSAQCSAPQLPRLP